MAEVSIADFLKLDIRIGTIVSAKPNLKAHKPAYILEIDFGTDIGVKISSAQLTQNYPSDALIGKQVSAVMNFPARRIAGVKSEVLVLAAVCERHGTVLLSPTTTVEKGTAIA